jgi:hypothetical protein
VLWSFSPRSGWRALTSSSASAPQTDASLAVETPASASASPQERVGTESAREVVATPGAVEPISAGLARRSTSRCFWEDDTAAAGVGFTLWPEDDPLAELHARTFETDGDGRARIDGLPGGRHTLHGDRGTQATAWLEAGEQLSLELWIAPGVDVLGYVVDGAGQPVGGAEVWLEPAPHRSGALANVVARTAADGSFRLRARWGKIRCSAPSRPATRRPSSSACSCSHPWLASARCV